MRDIEEVNRRTWRAAPTLHEFAEIDGYTDEGERRALRRLAGECQGVPVLDLGVGGGRTYPLLRSISRDYTGLDYTPEMVRLFHTHHPTVDVRHGDARDLKEFPSARFGLVVFSFNGIDSVSHVDRQRVLSEAYRVLRPGGLFLFSTHNLIGPGARQRFRLRPIRGRHPTVRGVAVRAVQAIGAMPKGLYNYWANRQLNVVGEGYAMRIAAAHDFGIVIHYTTLENATAELAAAGFEREPEVYGNDQGERIQAGDETRQVCWFHLIARKPARPL